MLCNERRVPPILVPTTLFAGWWWHFSHYNYLDFSAFIYAFLQLVFCIQKNLLVSIVFLWEISNADHK
jgi:hypothetical protein